MEKLSFEAATEELTKLYTAAEPAYARHLSRELFDLLLKYSTSQDGALHAEKYYRTAIEVDDLFHVAAGVGDSPYPLVAGAEVNEAVLGPVDPQDSGGASQR